MYFDIQNAMNERNGRWKSRESTNNWNYRRGPSLAIITPVKIIVATLVLLLSYILIITIRTRMYICWIFSFTTVPQKAIRTSANKQLNERNKTLIECYVVSKSKLEMEIKLKQSARILINQRENQLTKNINQTKRTRTYLIFTQCVNKRHRLHFPFDMDNKKSIITGQCS